MDAEGDLDFCWDGVKAASNARKYGVSFETAKFVFVDPNRMDEPDTFAPGEYRNVAVGKIDINYLAVVYIELEEGLIRIISARRATAQERRSYDRRIFHP